MFTHIHLHGLRRCMTCLQIPSMCPVSPYTYTYTKQLGCAGGQLLSFSIHRRWRAPGSSCALGLFPPECQKPPLYIHADVQAYPLVYADSYAPAKRERLSRQADVCHPACPKARKSLCPRSFKGLHLSLRTERKEGIPNEGGGTPRQRERKGGGTIEAAVSGKDREMISMCTYRHQGDLASSIHDRRGFCFSQSGRRKTRGKEG